MYKDISQINKNQASKNKVKKMSSQSYNQRPEFQLQDIHLSHTIEVKEKTIKKVEQI